MRFVEATPVTSTLNPDTLHPNPADLGATMAEFPLDPQLAKMLVQSPPLHPTPHTLRPTPYARRPTPYTPHPHARHHTHDTLHPTPHT